MINLKVYMGTSCHIKSSYNVICILKRAIAEYNLSDKIELSGIYYSGSCGKAVYAKIDDGEDIFCLTTLTAKKFFKEDVLSRL